MKTVYIFALSFIFAGLLYAEGGVTRALDATTGQGADDGNESPTKVIKPIRDDISSISMGLYLLTAVLQGSGPFHAADGTRWFQDVWESVKENLATVSPKNVGAEVFLDEFKKIDTRVMGRLQARVTTENDVELKRLFEEAKKLLNDFLNLQRSALGVIPAQSAGAGDEYPTRKIEPIPDEDIERIFDSLYRLGKATGVAKEFNADRGAEWLRYQWELLKKKLPIATAKSVGADILVEFRHFDAMMTERLQAPVTAGNFYDLRNILEKVKEPLDDIVNIVKGAELRKKSVKQQYKGQQPKRDV